MNPLSGSLLLCEKSVYGTRDAPRGFWKGLHDVLLKSGLLPLVYETSAYYLPGPKGKINGLLGCHVDDLLWCGGKEIDGVMEAVQRHYNFRMTSNDEFKFCGRTISRTADGITVTCPNVLDRVNIYLSHERRQHRGEGGGWFRGTPFRSPLQGGLKGLGARGGGRRSEGRRGLHLRKASRGLQGGFKGASRGLQGGLKGA